MKLMMFVVLDMKAGYYNNPHFLRSRGEALRAFADEANNSRDSMIGKFPEDFAMYVIGEYDSETAKMVLLEKPECMGKAADYVKVAKQVIV